ncbi:hypothetical protein Tco_0502203 [Tanacetum coccineum]
MEESSMKDKAKTAQESSSKRAGKELESDKSKKKMLDENVEAEIDDAKEAERLKQFLEIVLDDVTIDATLLSVKILIVDYKIHQEGKESFFQIIRADSNSQMYLTFTKMLKNFDREDLETMFENHVEDVQSIPYYLLVEKKYLLTKHTLHQMFNEVKLQVDYECGMAYELLRLVKKQLKEGYGRIVGIKRLHNDLGVNTVKLMLLVYKLLLLVFRVNVAGTKLQLLTELQLLKDYNC